MYSPTKILHAMRFAAIFQHADSLHVNKKKNQNYKCFNLVAFFTITCI